MYRARPSHRYVALVGDAGSSFSVADPTPLSRPARATTTRCSALAWSSHPCAPELRGRVAAVSRKLCGASPTRSRRRGSFSHLNLLVRSLGLCYLSIRSSKYWSRGEEAVGFSFSENPTIANNWKLMVADVDAGLLTDQYSATVIGRHFRENAYVSTCPKIPTNYRDYYTTGCNK